MRQHKLVKPHCSQFVGLFGFKNGYELSPTPFLPSPRPPPPHLSLSCLFGYLYCLPSLHRGSDMPMLLFPTSHLNAFPYRKGPLPSPLGCHVRPHKTEVLVNLQPSCTDPTTDPPMPIYRSCCSRCLSSNIFALASQIRSIPARMIEYHLDSVCKQRLMRFR